MWYVYNRKDSWVCGYTVPSEEIAIAICEKDKDMVYSYHDEMPY